MTKALRILVVEDEEAIAAIIGRHLHNFGHSFRIAANGDAARQLIGTEKFDAILTDFSFPNGNGNDIAKLFKEQNPDAPVYGMSGGHLSHFTDQFDWILEKPLSKEKLLDLFGIAD